jgi:hypothetical protein
VSNRRGGNGETQILIGGAEIEVGIASKAGQTVKSGKLEVLRSGNFAGAHVSLEIVTNFPKIIFKDGVGRARVETGLGNVELEVEIVVLTRVAKAPSKSHTTIKNVKAT